MNFKINNIDDLDMAQIYTLVNYLVKENKIKFRYYKNSSNNIELLQLCHNKHDNTIEFEFKDVMNDTLEDLKIIMNQLKNKT